MRIKIVIIKGYYEEAFWTGFATLASWSFMHGVQPGCHGSKLCSEIPDDQRQSRNEQGLRLVSFNMPDFMYWHEPIQGIIQSIPVIGNRQMTWNPTWGFTVSWQLGQKPPFRIAIRTYRMSCIEGLTCMSQGCYEPSLLVRGEGPSTSSSWGSKSLMIQRTAFSDGNTFLFIFNLVPPLRPVLEAAAFWSLLQRWQSGARFAGVGEERVTQWPLYLYQLMCVSNRIAFLSSFSTNHLHGTSSVQIQITHCYASACLWGSKPTSLVALLCNFAVLRSRLCSLAHSMFSLMMWFACSLE